MFPEDSFFWLSTESYGIVWFGSLFVQLPIMDLGKNVTKYQVYFFDDFVTKAFCISLFSYKQYRKLNLQYLGWYPYCINIRIKYPSRFG